MLHIGVKKIPMNFVKFPFHHVKLQLVRAKPRDQSDYYVTLMRHYCSGNSEKKRTRTAVQADWKN
jgi:hypothetical protein